MLRKTLLARRVASMCYSPRINPPCPSTGVCGRVTGFASCLFQEGDLERETISECPRSYLLLGRSLFLEKKARARVQVCIWSNWVDEMDQWVTMPAAKSDNSHDRRELTSSSCSPTSTYMCEHKHTCTHTSAHVYTHMYAHMHVHTHAHTCAHKSKQTK